MNSNSNNSQTLIDFSPGTGLMAMTMFPRDRGVLIEMSGANAGRMHCLVDQELSIGRDPKCTLCIDDNTLSRVHAQIRRGPDGYVMEDAGSRNGCYLNSERVVTRLLRHGDRIRLGAGVRMQFQLVNEKEEEILVHLYEAAVRDGLTGLFNRRHLDERLQQEVAYAIRHESGLAALIIDVDHFKHVNDQYGHLAGDEILRAMADLLKAQLRVEDLAARFGGEEFVILARDIPLQGAMELGERVRKAIEAMEVHFEGKVLKVTASIGASYLIPTKGGPGQTELLAHADEALYRAKSEGRNRVIGAAVE